MTDDRSGDIDFGLNSLDLEHAMISYAYDWQAKVSFEHTWKGFKDYYKCQETPAELFEIFWDRIMPNLQNSDVPPMVQEELSMIFNPRTNLPPTGQVYRHVTTMSPFAHERLLIEERQRKKFRDSKILALKAAAVAVLRDFRAEEDIQPERNQGQPGVDRSANRSPIDYLRSPSSLGGTLTGSLNVPEVDRSANRSTIDYLRPPSPLGGNLTGSLNVPGVDGSANRSPSADR